MQLRGAAALVRVLALAFAAAPRQPSRVKLFYTPTSPFVRKCLVVAHELGLHERIETETLRPSPTEVNPTLSAVNPLNKIPALVTDDGLVLYDSPVICEYLASLVPGQAVLPESGAVRFTALRRQALADGILDASVLVFYERLNRPTALWWDAWLVGQTQKALQGLDALEAEAATFGNAVDVGLITVASALGWLEYREVLGNIRESRPTLFAWYDRFATRPSMQATRPPE